MPSNNDGQQLDPNQQNIKAIDPPWLKNTSPMTMPQAGPNQDHMLAYNLAAGGFGTPGANFKWLDQMYDPVQTLKFGAPPKPTPKPVVKPDPHLQVVKDGKFVPVGTTGRNSR